MIKFENIYKRYDERHVALEKINLHCEKGEITVLIGPSGCGKTTTMKLINRLINPTSGQVFIDDQDIAKVDPVHLRRNIGYVIQQIGLFPHMTIAENVAVVPKLLKWKQERIDKRVNELLNLVGLEPEKYLDRYPIELSGGQQQRIGVIRAMAAEQAIILMDEPFSALDPISREQLQDELIRLQQEIKKTIVFVTHDMDEALKIADKIVLMRDGSIIQKGSPEEILRHPANEFVVNFIGKNRLQQIQEIPTVGEVMIRKPVTVFPNRGLASSIKVMESKQVNSLVVVNVDNQLLGYVTIYDVLNHFSDETKTVRDIIQEFSDVISADTLLTEAVERIDKNDYSYIPVVKEDQTLLGLLTRGSIVGHLSDVYSTSRNEGI